VPLHLTRGLDFIKKCQNMWKINDDHYQSVYLHDQAREIINECEEIFISTKRMISDSLTDITINQLKRARGFPPIFLGKDSWWCYPIMHPSQTSLGGWINGRPSTILKRLIWCKVPKLVWTNWWCHSSPVLSILETIIENPVQFEGDEYFPNLFLWSYSSQ
jgi:hypothetical protein